MFIWAPQRGPYLADHGIDLPGEETLAVPAAVPLSVKMGSSFSFLFHVASEATVQLPGDNAKAHFRQVGVAF